MRKKRRQEALASVPLTSELAAATDARMWGENAAQTYVLILGERRMISVHSVQHHTGIFARSASIATSIWSGIAPDEAI